jgi:hypothetical protein
MCGRKEKKGVWEKRFFFWAVKNSHMNLLEELEHKN